MKRVVLVLSLFVMSLFVSGYTFEADLTIDSNNKGTLTKKIVMTKEDINRIVCPGAEECNEPDDYVKAQMVNYINLDNITKKVAFKDKSTITSDKVEFIYEYDLGDIDDHVGPAYDKLSIFSSNFSLDFFSINGLNYKSNLEYKEQDYPNVQSATFILKVPNRLDSSNATVKDDKSHVYTWDLISQPSIDFVYKANANSEVAGDKEYGKIKLNKTMFIALGVVGGLVVILAFVNIIKKDKGQQKQVTQPENQPVFNQEIFNERATISKPSDMPEENDAFVPLDASQHEDVISNKFLDDSFAGGYVPKEEKPIETPVEEPKAEPLENNDIMPVEEHEEVLGEVQEETPEEPIQSDMSSVAFGGTPIDDKNINEIK